MKKVFVSVVVISLAVFAVFTAISCRKTSPSAPVNSAQNTATPTFTQHVLPATHTFTSTPTYTSTPSSPTGTPTCTQTAPTSTPTSTPTNTPVTCTKIFGNSDDSIMDNTWSSSFIVAAQFTAGSAANITDLYYRRQGDVAGAVALALYADNGGKPGTLLASGQVSSDAATWYDVPITPAVAVTSGTAYWIVSVCENDGVANCNSGCGQSSLYAAYSWSTYLADGFSADLSSQSWLTWRATVLNYAVSCQ